MRTITFKDVTPEAWSDLKQTIARDGGGILTGNEGVSVVQGRQCAYEYDPELMMLEVVEY